MRTEWLPEQVTTVNPKTISYRVGNKTQLSESLAASILVNKLFISTNDAKSLLRTLRAGMSENIGDRVGSIIQIEMEL